MPVHDWTRVEAGIFHDFHTAWVPQLRSALNAGLLPEGFYALAEQHAGATIADVLTLHASTATVEPLPPWTAASATAVAEAPPHVERRETLEPAGLARRRTLAVRHVSGHRLVAILEIVSPANKDRQITAEAFTAKVFDALDAGIHVMLVDLFPPGPWDPQGMHGLVRRRLESGADPYDLPRDRPYTLASYASGPRIDIYLEHPPLGSPLPEMPLFLNPNRYVNVPLEPTYLEAYRGMPGFWREVIEGKA